MTATAAVSATTTTTFTTTITTTATTTTNALPVSLPSSSYLYLRVSTLTPLILDHKPERKQTSVYFWMRLSSEKLSNKKTNKLTQRNKNKRNAILYEFTSCGVRATLWLQACRWSCFWRARSTCGAWQWVRVSRSSSTRTTPCPSPRRTVLPSWRVLRPTSLLDG